jgi:hypothetical protein
MNKSSDFNPKDCSLSFCGYDLKGLSDISEIKTPFFRIKSLSDYPEQHADYSSHLVMVTANTGINTITFKIEAGGDSHKKLLQLDPYDVKNKISINQSRLGETNE